jgi:hypothetical protein
MDGTQFDAMVRSVAQPATRRASLRALAGAGLLGLLARQQPAVTAQTGGQGQICTLAFAAMVRLGPSLGQPLVPGAAQAGELRGQLQFTLSHTGSLEQAALTLANGASVPVVGQVTGTSLELRIGLGQQVALVAIGVGEQPIANCQGAIDGVVTGPQAGDLGDWHAAPATGAGGQGAGGTTDNRGKKDKGGKKARANQGGTGQAPASGQGATAPSAAGGGTGSGKPGKQGGRGDQSGSQGGGQGGQSGTQGGSQSSAQSGPQATGGQPSSGGPTGPLGDTTDRLCDSPLILCDGQCIDPATTSAHCGACGNVCPAGTPVCTGGVCVAAQEPLGDTTDTLCDAPFLLCSGECVDAATDARHCGACGNACPADASVCAGSQCVPGQIVFGDTTDALCDSPRIICNGACVDPTSDPTNCGGCGLACDAGATCQLGTCVVTEASAPAPTGCDAGLTDCFGLCVNLADDPANCGVCGGFCAEGNTCQGGVCSAPAG